MSNARSSTIDHHFNWQELQQSSNSLSLFGERRLMDVRIPSGKPREPGQCSDRGICRSLPPDTITLVTLPRSDKQGQAAKWFKALKMRER